MVGVSAMSNVLGTINPVAEIAAVAHSAGALVMVDGAQLVPHAPVDVTALGADFLAFSGHKMMGRPGSACSGPTRPCSTPCPRSWEVAA